MIEERWEIPPTWSWASMEEIADVVGGGTPPAADEGNFADEGIAWLTPADLTGYEETYIGRGRRYLSEKGYRASAARLMPAGTVLFTSRAPVGYCAIASNEISTNQGFKSFVLKGGISPEYVRHYLLGSVDYAESKASGTTFKELSGRRAGELAAPIAPLPEQRRIVAKIDSLTGKSKRARDHLDHIPRLVEKYKQAVLAAAFDPDTMARWPSAQLEGVVADALIGLVRGKSEQSATQGVPYIRMNHYDLAGRWNEDDLTFVVADAQEITRYELRDGDLLFNTRNSFELVGKVALWNKRPPGYLYNNNLLRLRFKPEVLPTFAFYQMISPHFRSYLHSVKSATTSVCAIYQRSIMAAPWAYPDTDRQLEIANWIEAAFGRIDRLASEAASARRLIDRLNQAVLAKAYRGELIPQDPADEPASVLLERIRAERASASTPRRGRRSAADA